MSGVLDQIVSITRENPPRMMVNNPMFFLDGLSVRFFSKDLKIEKGREKIGHVQLPRTVNEPGVLFFENIPESVCAGDLLVLEGVN